jgi:hypothetical protein
MAPKRTKSNASELLSKLTTWAASIGESDNPYVQQLSDGLTQGTELEYWAEIEPSDFLPIPVNETPIKVQKRLERFFLLRSSLVFMPVAVTWLSVAQAAAAFNRFVNDHPSANTNFLIFWNHSHGYIPVYFELQSIADLDFIIITSAIVLNVIETRLQRIADKRSQDVQISQMAERSAIILEIKRYLRPYRKVTNESISQGVQASLRGLNEVHRNAAAVTKNLSIGILSNQKEAVRLEKIKDKLSEQKIKQTKKL